MELPESSSHRPLSSFQGSPRRPRHRVDAGEPRGCFSYFTNSNTNQNSSSQSIDYSSAASANRMLSEYSQQQLLREMLERQPKIGFEEAVEDTVKVNGCKKRKLYQPLRNGGEIQEPAPSPQLPSMHQTFPAQPSLQTWKESFKSSLLSSISELVDTQFQTLFQTLPLILPPPPPQPPTPNHNNVVANNILKLNHRFFKPPSTPHPPQLPPNPHFTSALVNLNNNYQASREDCESPLSLVVTPKKKRHKVTDTRLTPRAVSRLLDGGPTYIDASPPPVYFSSAYSSPPASLKEFVQSQMGGGGGGSGSGGGAESDGSISAEDSNYVGPTGGSSATLTPMHLRKAKLMFFWVRYPSSAVLKMYFPDIKFNKNNTAQLVKWFSNFREFYYIQMEKYARQALSEGVKNAEEIHVSVDHELYRVLNLHYNRNNHIEVPSNFRFVVEQTLREFFKAIQTGKDSEQSWKKAIYKIIARLDDPVPDYFKSPNFLEQLE